MTAPRAPAGGLDAVTFAERVLALLDEASFSTTYKHALLLALIDTCLEQVDSRGRAPSDIHPERLAERVVALYWPQSVPYGAIGPDLLRQANTGQAEVITSISRFRARAGAGVAATLAEARLASGWTRLIDDVTWKLVEMPLPRLQRIGTSQDRFIYEIGWDEKIARRDLHRPGFDPLVHLLPSVGDHLIRLVGLLRPLIQRQWAIRVCRYNPAITDSTGELERFLFGSDRLGAVRLRLALLDLQGGRCFYSGQRIDLQEANVDHFLPWARYPTDAIENLVVASQPANSAKLAYLAGPVHLAHWRDRLATEGAVLRQVATANRWPSQPDATLGVARAIYLKLRAGTPLWLAGRRFAPADPASIRAVLAS